MSDVIQGNKIVQIESSFSSKLNGETVDGIKGPVVFALTEKGDVIPIIINRETGSLEINPELSTYS